MRKFEINLNYQGTSEKLNKRILNNYYKINKRIPNNN